MARTEERPIEPTTIEIAPVSDDSFRPTMGGWAARGLVLAAIAAFVLGFPLSRPEFEVSRFSQAVIYGIIGLSLNVLIGYTGQISLGHQAFVGIGAFASAYLVTVSQQPFVLAVAGAMLAGALQAGILGGVALRIRGLYFALVTLSYGLVAESSLFKIKSFTGGAAGQAAPKPAGFDTAHSYYYLCLIFLALVLWVDYRMMKTKGGRALLALRENPRVAQTFGVNVQLFTLFSFMIAGVFAGLGGALYAHNITQVSSVAFEFRLALVFVIMTVVGGLRSRTGVVVGSAFFALLGFIIEHIPGLETALHSIPGVPDLPIEVAEFVIGPLLLLLTLTLFPGGLGQQLRPITQWLSGHRFDIHDRGAEEVQIADVRA
jgi:branched-chain amino acid transport system permease protein